MEKNAKGQVIMRHSERCMVIGDIIMVYGKLLMENSKQSTASRAVKARLKGLKSNQREGKESTRILRKPNFKV